MATLEAELMAAAASASAASPELAAAIAGVQWSLAHHLYDNARFLAERVHVSAPSAATAYVVATCHLRLNRPLAAYDTLHPWTDAVPAAGTATPPRHTVACRYLLGHACLALAKHAEGEDILARTLRDAPGVLTPDEESAVLYLLGVLSRYARFCRPYCTTA